MRGRRAIRCWPCGDSRESGEGRDDFENAIHFLASTSTSRPFAAMSNARLRTAIASAFPELDSTELKQHETWFSSIIANPATSATNDAAGSSRQQDWSNRADELSRNGQFLHCCLNLKFRNSAFPTPCDSYSDSDSSPRHYRVASDAIAAVLSKGTHLNSLQSSSKLVHTRRHSSSLNCSHSSENRSVLPSTAEINFS